MKDFALITVLSTLFGLPAFAMPSQVLIIRHAEKPPQESDYNLSPQGYQHAQELVPYFEHNPDVTRYGTPVAIYAMAPNGPDSGLRPIETVTPLAQALGLQLHESFGKTDTQALANEILTAPEYHGRMVLICWEHHHIPDIAQALGVAVPADSWPGSVFNMVWEINFTPGQAPQFKSFYQQLGLSW